MNDETRAIITEHYRLMVEVAEIDLALFKLKMRENDEKRNNKN